MSIVVTGRFEGLIQAEEAMTESLLRFPQEDVALVPPDTRADRRLAENSYVVIRTARSLDRRLAVRTLQGRGAVEVNVRVDATGATRARNGRTAAVA